MNSKESLGDVFRGGNRVPDLLSRRAASSQNGRIMPHAVSRHCDLGERQPLRDDGGIFGQGTLFPPYVNSGQIGKLQEMVNSEYHKWLKGRRSKVFLVQDAGGADRVTVKVKKYGIRFVGGFVRNGKIATVFTEDDD